MGINIKDTGDIAKQVSDFLYALGEDESLYDVEMMVSDIGNNNLDLETATDVYDYNKRMIVIESIHNGQFKQAGQQAKAYGLDYDLIKSQTRNQGLHNDKR